MRWFAGAILILLFSLAFGLGLLAYAMYCAAGCYARQSGVKPLVDRKPGGPARMQPALRQHRRSGGCECQRAKSRHSACRVAVDGRSVAARGNYLQAAEFGCRRAAYCSSPCFAATVEAFCSTPSQCNRRGYYQIGPLVLETGDLFGLHRRYRVATEPHFLLVYPQVIPLSGYDVASRRPIGEIRLQHRLYEDPTRIGGVRRYEAGDPLNRVHWRATARTGVLHSKVYEASTIAGATMLLDFHQASHPAKDEPYRSELAITAAASLANSVYEMGQQIGLDQQRPRCRRPHSPGRLEIRRLPHPQRRPQSRRHAGKKRSVATAGHSHAPRARTIDADSANAGPRGINRWARFLATGDRNHQPPAARRHDRGHFSPRPAKRPFSLCKCFIAAAMP